MSGSWGADPFTARFSAELETYIDTLSALGIEVAEMPSTTRTVSNGSGGLIVGMLSVWSRGGSRSPRPRGSMRTIKIGAECLAMLKRRRLASEPGQLLVFPSRADRVLPVARLADAWRAVVKGTELEWSTLRTLRSTSATRVSERYGLAAAREILGHDEGSQVTSLAYVPTERKVVNVADAR